jgi:hypothetical protein
LDHPNIHICDIYPAFIDMPGISHGANYTGRELSAPPPAYDARKVADTVVRVSRHLKATTTVGATADLVRFGHFFAPNLSARFMNWFMTTYFKQADPTAVTDGNLYALSSPAMSGPLRSFGVARINFVFPVKPSEHRRRFPVADCDGSTRAATSQYGTSHRWR